MRAFLKSGRSCADQHFLFLVGTVDVGQHFHVIGVEITCEEKVSDQAWLLSTLRSAVNACVNKHKKH